jgi:hypothetical protein
MQFNESFVQLVYLFVKLMCCLLNVCLLFG